MSEKKEKIHEHVREFIPEETREHLKKARAEMRSGIEAFLPPEVITHHRAARKEMLLAAREFINHAIDRVEDKEK